MRVILAAWLALTVVHQSTRGRKLTRYVDPFMFFLPLWTFFAPTPGSTDSEIAVRYYDAEGHAVEDWKRLDVYKQRKWSHALYHPNRRLEKIVGDASSHLLTSLREKQPQARILTSTPYLILLHVALTVSSLPAGGARVQFMLVHSGGYDTRDTSTTPVFLSAIHSL